MVGENPFTAAWSRGGEFVMPRPLDHQLAEYGAGTAGIQTRERYGNLGYLFDNRSGG